MKYLFAVLFSVLLMGSFTGCETMEGAGEDLEDLGQDLQDEAD